MRVVLAPVRTTQVSLRDQAPCHLAGASDNGLRRPAPEIKGISPYVQLYAVDDDAVPHIARNDPGIKATLLQVVIKSFRRLIRQVQRPGRIRLDILLLIKYPLIFGLPLERADGIKYNPALAAGIAAESVQNAESLTVSLLKGSLSAGRNEAQSQYLKGLQLFMLNYGGTVNRTGSGNPRIKIREADYDWF